MRFNNNNSIFSLYWSVGYYITVILNKLMYVFLIILSIILLRSSSVNGTFSTTINNIIKVPLTPYIYLEKLTINIANFIKLNFDSFINLKTKYENLKKVNLDLKIKLLRTNNVNEENNSLKRILNFILNESRENYTIKQINIINKGVFNTTIDIDINNVDRNNISEHDVVVDCDGNFVGIITDIKEKSATIMLATDYISKIPAKTIESNTSLILTGKGNNMLEIKHFLGRKENISNGDKVYTSNDGNIFFDWIYIGDIVNISDKIYVKLAANLNNLSYVIILHKEVVKNILEQYETF